MSYGFCILCVMCVYVWCLMFVLLCLCSVCVVCVCLRAWVIVVNIVPVGASVPLAGRKVQSSWLYDCCICSALLALWIC